MSYERTNMKKRNKTFLTLSSEDRATANRVMELIKDLNSGTIYNDEIDEHKKMISKRMTKLVEDVYQKSHPRAKGGLFYHLADGRWKSKSPDFYARSREELIEKLFEFYFSHTFVEVYEEWVNTRILQNVKSKKTIQEDLYMLKKVFKKEPIANVAINSITKKDIKEMFIRWTGPGLITRKAFVNRKAVLNQVFLFAAENDYIPINFISSIGTSELKFKEPNHSKKAYTVEERETLLRYLKTLKPDGYILAIMLAFYGTFRIGELRALKHEDLMEGLLYIEKQLVNEYDYDIDEKTSKFERKKRHINEKDPKGNPHFSKRALGLVKEAIDIIDEAKKINPDGKYLFMYDGREINNDTFNERLRKYTKEAGVPYLSSHKIRFTVASIMKNEGVDMAYIQYSLGHSNRGMTEHYVNETVRSLGNVNERLNSALSINY